MESIGVHDCNFLEPITQESPCPEKAVCRRTPECVVQGLEEMCCDRSIFSRPGKLRSGFRGIPGPPRPTRWRVAARWARASDPGRGTPLVPAFPRTLPPSADRPPIALPSHGGCVMPRPLDHRAGMESSTSKTMSPNHVCPRAERAPGRADAWAGGARPSSGAACFRDCHRTPLCPQRSLRCWFGRSNVADPPIGLHAPRTAASVGGVRRAVSGLHHQYGLVHDACHRRVVR